MRRKKVTPREREGYNERKRKGQWEKDKVTMRERGNEKKESNNERKRKGQWKGKKIKMRERERDNEKKGSDNEGKRM